MQQIPGVNLVDLQKLDERISGSTSKGNKVEKVKKDLFRKLTFNVSYLFIYVFGITESLNNVN